MGAPSNTIWGEIDGNGKGRLGIAVSTTNDVDNVYADVEVWFWSQWSVQDNNNTFEYNGESKGSVTINHTVASGGGWSTDNQTQLLSTTETYKRGNSNSTETLSASLKSIEVLSDTISVSTTVNIPAKTFWTNINVIIPPDNTEDSTNGARFDLKFSDETNIRTGLTNEPVPALYKPYNTKIIITNIEPLNTYHELQDVSGAKWDDNVVGYVKTVTDSSEIHINLKYKSYNLTIDPNGGKFNVDGSTEPMTPSKKLEYQSDTLSDVSTYIPIRVGYEFQGFYDSNGRKVYDELGHACSSSHWNADGTLMIYVYDGDLTVYAKWKPLNIAYLKSGEEWKLCKTYIKDEGAWKPAIMKTITKRS